MDVEMAARAFCNKVLEWIDDLETECEETTRINKAVFDSIPSDRKEIIENLTDNQMKTERMKFELNKLRNDVLNFKKPFV